MLSSRLEAVFDEFLNKVKEELKVAKIGEIGSKKMKKVQNPTNYGQNLEKSSQLEDRPSFAFKKRNLHPEWYTPLQSRSIEMKTRYPRKFSKFDRNPANTVVDERVGEMHRRKEEIRKRDFVSTLNLEPNMRRDYAIAANHESSMRRDHAIAPNRDANMKRCICKQHKNDAEHFYDIQMKSRFPRNQPDFGAEGVSKIRSQLRPVHKPKLPNMSAFTLTSITTDTSC